MKKETFVRIMKSLLKHIDESETLGENFKNMLAVRSTLVKEFSDGLDLIFYDDGMVEEIIKTLQEELGDTDELLVTWFYEYRTMGCIHPGRMTVIIERNGENTEIISVGVDPDGDDENLADLYDLIKEYYV